MSDLDSASASGEETQEDIGEVARRSLTHALHYAPNVSRALSRTASLLRSGAMSEAQELYVYVLDALSVLTFTVVSSARVLGAQVAHSELFDRALAPWLHKLEAAQEREDWLCVADYLEYEIDPIVTEWSRRMRAADRAGPSAGDPGDSH